MASARSEKATFSIQKFALQRQAQWLKSKGAQNTEKKKHSYTYAPSAESTRAHRTQRHRALLEAMLTTSFNAPEPIVPCATETGVAQFPGNEVGGCPSSILSRSDGEFEFTYGKGCLLPSPGLLDHVDDTTEPDPSQPRVLTGYVRRYFGLIHHTRPKHPHDRCLEELKAAVGHHLEHDVQSCHLSFAKSALFESKTAEILHLGQIIGHWFSSPGSDELSPWTLCTGASHSPSPTVAATKIPAYFSPSSFSPAPMVEETMPPSTASSIFHPDWANTSTRSTLSRSATPWPPSSLAHTDRVPVSQATWPPRAPSPDELPLPIDSDFHAHHPAEQPNSLLFAQERTVRHQQSPLRRLALNDWSAAAKQFDSLLGNQICNEPRHHEILIPAIQEDWPFMA